MQHRTRLIGSISCLILAVGTAQADVTTFQPNSGIWNLSINWNNGIPTEADRAVIPAGKTCTIDIATAFADTIDVQASGMSIGELIINGDKKLTLDNDDDEDNLAKNSIVDGLLTLNGSGAILDFIENDHGVSGDGEIHGKDNNARIQIAYGIKFTSRLAVGGVTGAMVIEGFVNNAETEFGTFRNEGLVMASVGTVLEPGVLELHVNTILEDHDTDGIAIWTSGDAFRPVLLFSRDASLNGNFDLFCDDNYGTIHIKADIDTCGTLRIDAGRLKVFSGSTFRYGKFRSRSVSNPGSSISVGCLNWSLAGCADVSGPICSK